MTKLPKPGRAWMARNMAAGRRAVCPVAALGVTGTLAAIGQAWCLARLLADAITTAPPQPGASAAPWALLFAVLTVLRAGLLVVSDDVSFTAGVAARRRLRSDLFVRLFGAGPGFLRGARSGELAALAVDRIEALEGLFARWLPASVLALASPLLVGLAVLLVDPWGALILGAAGLLVPVGMALAGLGAAAASQRQFVAMGRLQARFLDRVRGVATIVLAGRAEQEARRLQTAADDLGRRTLRVLRVAFLSSAALDCAAAAALVLLAGRYAAAWRNGASPAAAIFVLVLVAEFFAPLRAFSAAYQDRLQAAGAAEQLAGLPEVSEAAGAPPPIRTVAAQGVTVAFHDVRYTWDPSRGAVLDGLSFRVPAGETMVLVGPSGAGKSTVIELLLGFVRPDSGRITLNGADIGTVVPSALARMTAWIGQRPVLFAGSIRDNIRFGREDATDQEVEDAARAAGIASFAAALPEGLDTPIGEGGYGLSGGQAQRVAVARAFVRNAPLLLLDEPTAHLDPATEADVLDSLRRLALGRTVILASHSAAAHAFGGRMLELTEGRTRPVQGVA